jgi:hypothetical protein
MASAGMINAQYPKNVGITVRIMERRPNPPKEVGKVT